MGTETKHNLSEQDLQQIFLEITAMEKVFILEAKDFLSAGQGYLHTMDLFISAIINRSISLMRGFLTLAKDNNYISSIPLIRMQVDNCMRLYAATLVSDYNQFFIQYLGGERIGNIKDNQGKKMTDTYLITKLDKEVCTGIKKLYEYTSDYVHFSNQLSLLTTKIVPDKERTVGTRIGVYDFYEIDQKVDFAFNMLKASQLLIGFVKSWKPQKLKIEKQVKSKPN